MDEPLEAELSAEVARLLTEHQRYSLRLHELVTKPYLSSEEQMEEVRLKKLKLHTKDLMSAIQHRAMQSHVGAGQARTSPAIVAQVMTAPA